MNANTEKTVVGKALYLELRKDNYTYQMIITPPATNAEGGVIPACVMERRLSSWHPRKNWNFSSVPTTGDFVLPRQASGEFQQETDLNRVKHISATHLHRLVSKTIDSLIHRDWKLLKQPITVEATYKDVELIKSGKTSNELVRRIERSRKAFNFPEALFDAPAPVAPATPTVVTLTPVTPGVAR